MKWGNYANLAGVGSILDSTIDPIAPSHFAMLRTNPLLAPKNLAAEEWPPAAKQEHSSVVSNQSLQIEGRSQSPCPFPARERQAGAGGQRTSRRIDTEARDALVVAGVEIFP